MAQQLGMETVRNIRGVTNEVNNLDSANRRAQQSGAQLNATVNQGFQKAQSGAGKAADETKRFGSGMEYAGLQMAAVATGAVMLGNKIQSTVRREWQLFLKDMQEAGRISDAIVEKLQGVVAAGGMAGMGPQIRGGVLRHLGKTGPMSESEIVSSIDAFVGTAKDTSPEEIDRMLSVAQVLAASGRQDVKTIAKGAGGLRQAGMADIEQAMNLSALIATRGGEEADKILKYMRFGMQQTGGQGYEQVAALLLAGARGGRKGLSAATTAIEYAREAGITDPDAIIQQALVEEPTLAGRYRAERGLVGGYGDFARQQARLALANDPILAARLTARREEAGVAREKFNRAEEAELLRVSEAQREAVIQSRSYGQRRVIRSTAWFGRLLEAAGLQPEELIYGYKEVFGGPGDPEQAREEFADQFLRQVEALEEEAARGRVTNK